MILEDWKDELIGCIQEFDGFDNFASFREAEDTDDASYVLHLHHSTLVEPTEEPILNRIAYIAWMKKVDERALRFRCMRPTTLNVFLKFEELRNKFFNKEISHAEYQSSLKALHDTICSCPWKPDHVGIFAESDHDIRSRY